MAAAADICVSLVFVDFVSANMHLKGKSPVLERLVGKKNMKFNMTNYDTGDFLIKMKNASMAKNKEITVRATKKIIALAETLKKMGFVDSVKKEKDALTVSLTFKDKKPLLMNVILISKPGLRIYKSIAEIEKRKSPATYLISSTRGIISTKEAVKYRIGGEIIAEIL